MAKSLFSLDRQKPQVMAILNTTPDSLSDGGQYYQSEKLSLDACRRRVDQMVAEGASIIDIGGESTRPGSKTVSLDEEMQRVLPLLEAVRDYDVVFSIDTSSPELMLEAAKLGAGLLNDIRAFQREGALQVAAQTQLPICVMHMQGTPNTMQVNPQYHDVLQELGDFFMQRCAEALQAGVKKHNILLDPGFGFGKNLQHNRTLLNRLDSFQALEMPLLVGLSRKAMIGQILNGRDVSDRLAGSIALAMLAVQKGAWIVRVHDVKATVDALKVMNFIESDKGL